MHLVRIRCPNTSISYYSLDVGVAMPHPLPSEIGENMNENEKKSSIQNPEPLPSFSSLNKFHTLLGGEAYSTRVAKDTFMHDLKKAQKNEREYCSKFKVDAVMTQGLFNEISTIVDRCDSLFDVEALARFVFNENYVPTIDEVKVKSKNLYAAFPFYHLHKQNAKRGSH